MGVIVFPILSLRQILNFYAEITLIPLQFMSPFKRVLLCKSTAFEWFIFVKVLKVPYLGNAYEPYINIQ